MKNLILILVMIITGANNLSANEIGSNDTCRGIVEITKFYINGIPLYEKIEGESYDTIIFRFRLENGEIVEIDPKVEEFSIPVNAQLIVTLKSGERFGSPYHFYVGERVKWEHFRGTMFMEYKLSFRLIGNYGDWLCIVINEKENQTAFIHRDETFIHFKSWEDFIKDWGNILFSDSNIFDAKNGKEIKFKKEERKKIRNINQRTFDILLKEGQIAGQIILTEGDWMCVRCNETDYWIKWKDKNGLLIHKVPHSRFIY